MKIERKLDRNRDLICKVGEEGDSFVRLEGGEDRCGEVPSTVPASSD
jgi:hypothetical protein